METIPNKTYSGDSIPFKSKAQMKFLFVTKPKLAREFAKKTKDIKRLPYYKNK